ncbi:MAG: hypothetical protein VYD72_04580 [Chloroflexota bacterium]|nr:hypothetical protein [Chloroflexota bacterium]
MKNANFLYLMLGASFIAFVVSVYLWFFMGNKEEAIFVGIWVPSILAFAGLLQVSRE